MIAALFLAASCASCAPLPAPVPLGPGCTVTDGDTIRCGDERIRLTGIDAPELHGCHGRRGRVCVAGDGPASRAALVRAMAGRPLAIVRLGTDRYHRTLAVVYAGGVNLACSQLREGAAIYVKRWDSRRAVARDCSVMAQ